MVHPLLVKIRKLREQKGYSQEEMAYKLGITQSSYARFESGNKKIDFALLEKIASLFETDISELTSVNKNNKYPQEELIHIIKEQNTGYHQSQFNDLLKRIDYLEKLNETLYNRLKDKEEIITLLKQQKIKLKKYKKQN